MIVRTPQFTRQPGTPAPASPPSTREDWEALKSLDAVALKELGLRKWGDDSEADEPSGRMLWLFPGEWYTSVPQGFVVTDIFWNEEPFVLGITDDDIRFGCLSFGIVGPA